LRYDCRGQGSSPSPEGVYHLRDHVDDLRNLITDLNLKKIIIIGLSNGGRIALSYASKFEVFKVVALDTYDEVTPLLKKKLESWLIAHRVGGPLHRFDVATPWIWGEEVFNLKHELILSYRERAGSLKNAQVEGLILGALESKIDLSKIDSPVLLIVGKEDLLTPIFYHENMLKKCKNGKLKIVDGGHASIIERPAIVDQAIIPWINNGE
jgi:3-oxoadipate enol-lactonase